MVDEYHKVYLSDIEFRLLLLEQGYDVPVMVIRTWPKKSYSVYSKIMVQRWIIYQIRRKGHRPKFPQFLVHFDVQVNRKLQSLDRSRMLTPRLPRIHPSATTKFPCQIIPTPIAAKTPVTKTLAVKRPPARELHASALDAWAQPRGYR